MHCFLQWPHFTAFQRTAVHKKCNVTWRWWGIHEFIHTRSIYSTTCLITSLECAFQLVYPQCQRQPVVALLQAWIKWIKVGPLQCFQIRSRCNLSAQQIVASTCRLYRISQHNQLIKESGAFLPPDPVCGTVCQQTYDLRQFSSFSSNSKQYCLVTRNYSA